MQFSAEILAIITLYTGDIVVAQVLRKYMTKAIYRTILLTKRRILIYGQVQSGKTGAIMDVIHNPLYTGITKIVVIQNSLLVLAQYKERFSKAQISFQCVDSDTTVLDKPVVILMNNAHRYNHYLRANKPYDKYIVIMDEADAYGQHAVAENAVHEYYVTATPYTLEYNVPQYFNHIQSIDPPKNYQGLRNVIVKYDDATVPEIVGQFYADTSVSGGIMLINSLQYVYEMRETAHALSKLFPTICFVTLNDVYTLYMNGKLRNIRKRSIAKIIDLLKLAPHIVFIANRLSLRGLSYTSGNYTRHLTHQYSDLRKKNVTNALQRMRIFGIYADQQPVTLILPTNNYKKVNKMLAALDVDYELNRSFVIV